MSRPRKEGTTFPQYMYRGDRDDFVIKPPKGFGMTKTRYRKDQEELCRQTAELVALAIEKQRLARMLNEGKPLIAGVIDGWMRDKLEFQGWKGSTRDNKIIKFNRIKAECGQRRIDQTDSKYIVEWISAFCHTANTFNAWLLIWRLICGYAVERKMLGVDNVGNPRVANEGMAVQMRSDSKVIEANQKVRHPIDLQGFRAVYKFAPNWLQLAMDLALVLLQGRSEVCDMRHTDFRNGALYVIREKVSTMSDHGFLAIRLTDDLQGLRSRALRQDNAASPFLVHRMPEGRVRAEMDAAEHWTEIRPAYLTKAFQKAREASHYYDHLRDEEKPTFHEIRGLGSRLSLAVGMSASEVQALLAHTDPKTSKIYTMGGKEALRDSMYKPVAAPAKLADLMAAVG